MTLGVHSEVGRLRKAGIEVIAIEGFELGAAAADRVA
jgi:hypothetical protein